MLGFVSKLFGQDSSLKTVTLKQAKNSGIVLYFDTISFQTDKKEIIRTFNNVEVTGSIVKLENIPSGKYNVSLSCKGISVSPIFMTVCTKCDSSFEYYASTEPNDGKGLNYIWVNEMPQYNGGNYALAKDFQNALSKSDREILMQASNVTITFFMTKNKEVCDIAFTPGDISKEISAIIAKGILMTKNWNNGKQNGMPSDEIFTIDKETLMKS